MSLYWPGFKFDFSLNMARLVPHIAAVEANKAAVTSMRIVPPQWRVRPAAEVEASLSAMIEQSGAQLEEIQLRKHRFLLSNSSAAQAWVKQRFTPGSAPMCLDDVLAMHRMVSEEAGVRHKMPGVMRADGQAVVTGTVSIGLHVGAPAFKLPMLMDGYFRFINGTRLHSLPPIIHALVAHFFITTIHPFVDGNGRVSRLVAAGILFQRGYNGHGFYALSNYFYEHEETYHRILLKLQQDPCPDLTEFVAFGMEGLVMELRGINNFIRIKLNRVGREMRA